MKVVVSLILLFGPCLLLASDVSPYAGQELRTIKSLSEKEIESLRRGDGVGFAKLAELNHFPGPRHVLEISDELELSPSQLAETESLFVEMKSTAIVIGIELLAAESRLNGAFEQESINSQSLEAALLDIGELRAQLRYAHLEAHLRQRQLLTPQQNLKYDSLRGYHGTAEKLHE